MPIQMIDLVGMNNSFLRPVVADVVDQIASITKLTLNKEFIITENSGPMVPGSAIGNTSQKDIVNPTGHDQAIRIEVDEEIIDESLGSGRAKLEYAKPVFNDPDTGVRVFPVRTQTVINLSVIARFGSRTEAEQWRLRNRREAQQGRWQLQHQVNYHYMLPNELVLFLNHIHELRELKAPYNESLPEYLKPRLGNTVEVLSDQAGNNRQLAVMERAANIVGTFDFNTIPDKVEKDKDRVVWEIKFGYKIILERPISLCVTYPVMIHNSYIDAKYIPQYDKGLVKPVAVLGDALVTNLVGTVVNYPPPPKPPGMVSTPYYDDWVPKYRATAQLPLYMFLLQVDATDKRDVVNLNDLGDYQLHPLFIPYLQSNPDTILRRHGGLFSIIFHEDSRALQGELFTIDSELKIRSTFDMNMRKTYRMVYNLTADPSAISGRDLKNLLAFGELILYTFESVYINIFRRRLPKPTLRANGSLNERDWEAMVRVIKAYYLSDFTKSKGTLKNVGNYFISIGAR